MPPDRRPSGSRFRRSRAPLLILPLLRHCYENDRDFIRGQIKPMFS